MSKPSIYLAGPVQHAVESGRDWREELKRLYGDRWDFLDPLDKYDVAAEDLTIVGEGPAGEGEITRATLVETDKAFVDEADAVFVGWSVVPSVGTPMEMLYAYERGTPVGVWYDGDDVLSPWMRYHADVVHDQPEIVLLQLTETLEEVAAAGDDSTGYLWDHEDCPRKDCDGELQHQDKFNVMCLSCERVWSHVKTETKHLLQTEDFETVAEKPVAVPDGDGQTGGFQWDHPAPHPDGCSCSWCAELGGGNDE
jgi:nucleoside 2-deoxyribosyltransferase